MINSETDACHDDGDGADIVLDRAAFNSTSYQYHINNSRFMVQEEEVVQGQTSTTCNSSGRRGKGGRPAVAAGFFLFGFASVLVRNHQHSTWRCPKFDTRGTIYYEPSLEKQQTTITFPLSRVVLSLERVFPISISRGSIACRN